MIHIPHSYSWLCNTICELRQRQSSARVFDDNWRNNAFNYLPVSTGAIHHRPSLFSFSLIGIFSGCRLEVILSSCATWGAKPLAILHFFEFFLSSFFPVLLPTTYFLQMFPSFLYCSQLNWSSLPTPSLHLPFSIQIRVQQPFHEQRRFTKMKMTDVPVAFVKAHVMYFQFMYWYLVTLLLEVWPCL